VNRGPGTQVRHVVPPWMGVPIVDHHDHIFRVFLGLPVPGEGGHKILHHATVLELMLDGVCVVRACLLEESLEVLCQWPLLALATARDGHNALHVEVAYFLVVVVFVVGHSCNPLRVSFRLFLPPLAFFLASWAVRLDGAALLLSGVTSLPLG
jgi:hypothetical protein